MSTSSIKRHIGRFYIVVMQWTSKKCTEKRDAHAEQLFCSQNQLFLDVVVVVIVPNKHSKKHLQNNQANLLIINPSACAFYNDCLTTHTCNLYWYVLITTKLETVSHNHSPFFSCPQGAPLSSLNIVPVCSLQLPPLVPQPDHTVLVRVSSSFLNFCL